MATEAPHLGAPQVSTPFGESIKRGIPKHLVEPSAQPERAPPAYAREIEPDEPEVQEAAPVVASTKGQQGVVENGGPKEVLSTGAWKELLDISKEEVRLTLTFFAAPWAVLVLTARLLNWLITLVWGSPLIARPANLLFTLIGPPIVFHFAMVSLVLVAQES